MISKKAKGMHRLPLKEYGAVIMVDDVLGCYVTCFQFLDYGNLKSRPDVY